MDSVKTAAALHVQRLLGQYVRASLRRHLQRVKAAAPEESSSMPGRWVGEAEADVLAQEREPDRLDEESCAAFRRQRGELVRRWLLDPPEPLLPLAELAVLFDLDETDIELLLLIVGPDLQEELARLYVYATDRNDGTPTAGFVKQVFGLGDEAAGERVRLRLAHEASLRRHRLVLAEPVEAVGESLALTLARRRLRVPDRVLDFLLRGRGQEGASPPPVAEPLAHLATRLRQEVPLEGAGLDPETEQALVEAVRSRRLPLVLEGEDARSKQRAALAMGTLMGKGLLEVDLAALLHLPDELLTARLAEIFREGRLGGDLIYLWGKQLPERIELPRLRRLRAAVGRENAVVSVPQGLVWCAELTVGWPVLHVPQPTVERRRQLWERAMGSCRQPPEPEAVETIARRYQMTERQIQHAAVEARRLGRLRRRKGPGLAELDAACRAQFAHQLSDLAQALPPTSFTTDDLILPQSERSKFLELLEFADHHQRLLGEWGFDEVYPYGRGLSVLFFGPPGTGKTMAATIIAGRLGLDLFRIDLSRIVSRYVGETEKNLARVFDEAERGRALLLFDEADSLFSKRTSVKSSTDRYANLEVAYLLQRMENFDGLTVLTTNVEHQLDEAFKRRLRYKLHFPFPDATTRAQLWQRQLPSAAPRRPHISFDLLGEHFELSGGMIKAAVLRGAFYAMRQGQPIGLTHLAQAAVAECREAGVLVRDSFPTPLARAIEREREAAC